MSPKKREAGNLDDVSAWRLAGVTRCGIGFPTMRQTIGFARHNRITAKFETIFLGVTRWPTAFAARPDELPQFQTQWQILFFNNRLNLWLFGFWLADR